MKIVETMSLYTPVANVQRFADFLAGSVSTGKRDLTFVAVPEGQNIRVVVEYNIEASDNAQEAVVEVKRLIHQIYDNHQKMLDELRVFLNKLETVLPPFQRDLGRLEIPVEVLQAVGNDGHH